MRPADIARRARELADKREKSAASCAPHVREQLLATARNYRALAAELERKIPPVGALRTTAPTAEPLEAPAPARAINAAPVARTTR